MIFELQRGGAAKNRFAETSTPFYRAYGVLSFGKRGAVRKRMLSTENNTWQREKMFASLRVQTESPAPR